MVQNKQVLQEKMKTETKDMSRKERLIKKRNVCFIITAVLFVIAAIMAFPKMTELVKGIDAGNFNIFIFPSTPLIIMASLFFIFLIETQFFDMLLSAEYADENWFDVKVIAIFFSVMKVTMAYMGYLILTMAIHAFSQIRIPFQSLLIGLGVCLAVVLWFMLNKEMQK